MLNCYPAARDARRPARHGIAICLARCTDLAACYTGSGEDTVRHDCNEFGGGEKSGSAFSFGSTGSGRVSRSQCDCIDLLRRNNTARLKTAPTRTEAGRCGFDSVTVSTFAADPRNRGSDGAAFIATFR